MASRRAQVLRSWRIALLLFAFALTVATHWPRLQLSGEIPASDKAMHMLAFAILTLLLWRSGLFGPRWLVAIIAIAWACMDEVSQGIPILRRTVSWHDLIANACGVISAMALIWAMRPIQSRGQFLGPNDARSRLFEFTFDQMFARRKPWMIGVGTGLASVAIIFAARPLLPSAGSVGAFGLMVFIVAAHVLYLVYRRMFFHEFQRVQREQPCLACGAEPQRATDSGECGACGAGRYSFHYAVPPRPSFAAIVRVSLFPAAIALGGIAMLFAMVLLLPHAYGWAIATPSGRSTAPRLAQLIGRLPRDVTGVIDLTVYMLLIAAVIRIWRRRFAAYIDRAVRCRKCGHDLHGTPTNERGEGHCGECGAPFVRA